MSLLFLVVKMLAAAKRVPSLRRIPVIDVKVVSSGSREGLSEM